MTHTFKLSRRTARLRPAAWVPLLVLAGACDNTGSLAPTTDEATALTTAEATAPSFAITSSSISISNLSARSGKTYRVAWGFTSGSTQYIDRTFTASSVPSAVQGLAYIQTANGDKNAAAGSTSFLSFDINTGATIYVAHDNRLPRPSWLSANFQDAGFDLTSSDGLTRFSVFKRSFAAGRVTLGSNVAAYAGSEQSMYLVLVQPTGTTPTPTPTPDELSEPSIQGTGMPFGIAHLPTTQNGSVYNGALRNIFPAYLLSELAAIKARGGKVILALSGNEKYYLDSRGYFSLSLWKSKLDQYRNVNFSSYINDGTIIGNYLIDEPYDPANWGGVVVSPAVVEEMAKYSKSIWPTMPTIVRADPIYMGQWSGTYQYLDAAWAQYLYRRGDVSKYIASNVAAAKQKGLALVVGLNVQRGGIDGVPMTASQISSWGSALMSDAYPCSFISWPYDGTYLSRSDIKSAMSGLRTKANARVRRECRGT